MNPWKTLGTVLLVLLLVFLGGFGGCLAGGTIGDAIDTRNGTFGKGLEGSPYGLGLALLGWIGGMVIAGVLCALYLRRRKP